MNFKYWEMLRCQPSASQGMKNCAKYSCIKERHKIKAHENTNYKITETW